MLLLWCWLWALLLVGIPYNLLYGMQAYLNADGDWLSIHFLSLCLLWAVVIRLLREGVWDD